eukprot:TRINITY_DN1069_c0_g1_i2.p1 TRINITY_DN1069_c0_g1~~TRINITY_DN1069_c0_g1_i2.p1  ORF type:complete len:497 (+),score=86.84 TRINITY_DN1069_c0_g1_i2:710-2200(+)
MIIVGPKGAGQHVLAKEALRDWNNVLYLDLHRNPVASAEEFLRCFCEAIGYKMPVNNELVRFLLREPARKSRITHEEAEQALSVFSTALSQEKARGWRNGIPIIVLDDIPGIFGEQKENAFAQDPFFTKFSDWLIHLYESKLAHVIFVSSYSGTDVASRYSLRFCSTLVWINFPSKKSITRYLVQEFRLNESAFASHGQELPSDVQLDWIVNCIGGHMQDLDHVQTAVIRGEQWSIAIKRLVAESINFIESYMETILNKAATATEEEKMYSWEKYLRFWDMMKMLRDTAYVNRRDMVNGIFHEYITELDEYANANIVCYLTRGTRTDLGDSEIEQLDLEEDSTPEKEANLAKATVNPDDEERFMLLSEGLGGWIVSCSSRNRIAFDSILNHQRLQKFKKMIQNKVKAKALTLEIEKMRVELAALKEEQTATQTNLLNFAKEAVTWRELLGDEEYEERKTKLMQKATEKRNKFESTEAKLGTNITKLDTLMSCITKE